MAQTSVATSFSKLFNDRLDDIERRALKAGTNLTAVCKDIGISRSTPDRWRRYPPRTVVIIEQLDECVSSYEKGVRRAAKGIARRASVSTK